MEHLQHAGEHLDQCGGCGGVWFDEGELRAYAHARVAANLREGTLRRYFRSLEGEGTECPACGSPALRAGEAGGLALRGCDGCGGFFLPPATLEKLDGLAAVGGRPSLFANLDMLDLEYLGEAALQVLQHLRR